LQRIRELTLENLDNREKSRRVLVADAMYPEIAIVLADPLHGCLASSQRRARMEDVMTLLDMSRFLL
jgi:hypothetical protein